MLNSSQKNCHTGAAFSLLALIVLCIAWEWLLAPLRPGGSWLVLKVLPLLLPLKGVLRRDVYTLQWASMLVLLYFAEGVVRAMTDPGLSAALAGLEIILSMVFFACSLCFLRPYKQAAKQKKKQASGKGPE